MTLKQLEIEKIIDKFYTNRSRYKINCDFHDNTDLVIKKILHHTFPATRSMCFTALAECPICNSKFIVFGGGSWATTIEGIPVEYFTECPIIFRVEDVHRMLKVVKMFSHHACTLNSIRDNAIKYLLYLYNPMRAKKYLKARGISMEARWALLADLNHRARSMAHEHQTILGTINIMNGYYTTSNPFTQIYFTDQLLKTPKYLQQTGKEEACKS